MPQRLHLVFGGELVDPQRTEFRDVDAIDIVGIFADYASAYVAWKEAQAAARDTGSLQPPKHIMNAPTVLMRDLGYGSGYAYDHDEAEGFSGQDYFPDGMERRRFYRPYRPYRPYGFYGPRGFGPRRRCWINRWGERVCRF